MPSNKKNVEVSGKENTNRRLERRPVGNASARSTFFKSALAKQVRTDDLSPDDVIIVVMGPTGSGRSSFINAISGLETGVGHNLESCTSSVSNVRLSIPEIAFGDLVFVDTPGFDDTHIKDVDILKMVADWLKSTYEKNILLSGLLYFHRISDNRMAGTPLKNLRMFEELCGKNAFHSVILTTTMWDEVDEETGEERERELKDKYWKSMLELNSTTSRFLRTRESAFDIIEPLIDAANKRSSVLLQDELVDMRKSLPATAAGQELFSAMGQLVSQRENLLRRIGHEMRHSDGDKMALESLQEEHQRLRNTLEATVIEMRRMRLPLGKRLLIMLDKFFSSTFEYFRFLVTKRLSKPAVPNTELPAESDMIVIAIIGPNGVGKSSFINIAADERLEISHSLGVCTTKFAYVRCTLEDSREVVFADIPAFHDPEGYTSLSTEQKVGNDINEWVKEALGKRIKVSRILYLQDISKNRLTESLVHPPYEIFRKLCGKEYSATVALVLTMCENIAPETCQARTEYFTNHWKKTMGEKALVCCHHGTKKSAWDVVAALGVI